MRNRAHMRSLSHTARAQSATHFFSRSISHLACSCQCRWFLMIFSATSASVGCACRSIAYTTCPNDPLPSSGDFPPGRFATSYLFECVKCGHARARRGASVCETQVMLPEFVSMHVLYTHTRSRRPCMRMFCVRQLEARAIWRCATLRSMIYSRRSAACMRAHVNVSSYTTYARVSCLCKHT